MKKFLPWLIPITLLLAAVPVLLMSESAGVAKAVGIIMVALTTIALRFWLYNAGKLRKHSNRVLFTVNERYILESLWPYYKVMPKSQKLVLEERAGLLLAGLSFDNFDHSEPSGDSCLVFSMVLAALIPEGTFRHPEHKVVVFRKGVAEMAVQDIAAGSNEVKSTVLFVDDQELKQVLETSVGGKLSEAMQPATLRKLQEFYVS